MVAPEREMPGISAVHCQSPTITASSSVMLDSLRCPPAARSRSPAISSTPFTTRNAAAITGEPNSARRRCSSKPPTITAGMVAMMISISARRLSRT